MEPIEWIIILSLIFGGHELLEKHNEEKDGVIVVENALYERGKYFKSDEGYFVSNLSVPEIELTTQEADCTYLNEDSGKKETLNSTPVKTPLLKAGCDEK